MAEAESDGRAWLDACEDDLVRSFAATGLLHAALEGLDDGPAREAAIDVLEEALAGLRRRPA